MTLGDTDDIDQQGVALVKLRAGSLHGWIFRSQDTSDYGIDAHVEIRTDGKPTGRLIGLQIKTGKSYFRPAPNGWVYYPSDRHVAYWLGHSLPTFVILVNLEDEQVYWQRVTPHNLERTRSEGWKLVVPRSNTLQTARSAWELAASGLEQQAAANYEQNLEVLPPAVVRHLRRVAEKDAIAAALIAAHLASSRTVADLVTKTLLTATPLWLGDAGAEGWLAVASFASSYGFQRDSVAALLLAAELDPERQGRIRAGAGLRLISDDPARAIPILERAMTEPEGALRGALGLEIARHAIRDIQEVVLPDPLARQVIEATDDPAILSVRADQASRAGRHDEAVQLWEQALSLLPDDSDAAIWLAQALLRRANTAAAQPDDLIRARTTAESALDQIHKWEGPSGPALEVLIQAYGQLGESDGILYRSMLPPEGGARADEASSPAVIIHAIRAAAKLDRFDLMAELIERLPTGADREFAEAEYARHSGENAERQVARWRAVIEAADVEEQPERLVEAVMQLAEHATDESDRLGPLVASRVVASETQELVKAVAGAHRDLDRGLPALRALSDRNPSAAESLAILLAKAERVDEAEELCRRAASRFNRPSLLALRAEILHYHADANTAEAAAIFALAQPAISALLRDRLYELLIMAGSRQDNWQAVEQYCIQAITNRGPDRIDGRVIWQLVVSQLNQQAQDRAAATVRRYRPTVASIDEARLWLRALALEGWDADRASQALSLSVRFSDDARLSAALLTHVILSTRDDTPADGSSAAGTIPGDTRQPIPSELRRRAFEALDQHVARHGAAGGITVLGTVKQLVSVLNYMLVTPLGRRRASG